MSKKRVHVNDKKPRKILSSEGAAYNCKECRGIGINEYDTFCTCRAGKALKRQTYPGQKLIIQGHFGPIQVQN